MPTRCTPGHAYCNDHLTLQTCAANGSDYTAAACASDQVCFGATCVRSRWTVSYGGPRTQQFYGSAASPEGPIVAVGFDDPALLPDSRALAVRFALDGTVLSAHRLNGSARSLFWGASTAPDAGYYAAGLHDADALAVRLDADGAPIWMTAVGGTSFDFAYGITAASDGGAYLVGETGAGGPRDQDMLVVRLGPDGAVRWSRAVGGDGADWGEGIVEASGGGVVVVGFTHSFRTGTNGPSDAIVAKLSPDGDLLWARVFGTSGTDGLRRIREVSGGDLIAAGQSGGPSERGANDGLVVRLGSEGSLSWGVSFGRDDVDSATGLVVTPTGRIVAVGETQATSAARLSAYVLHLTTTGDVIGGHLLGRSLNDTQGTFVVSTADGAVVVAAREQDTSGALQGQGLVAKLDPDLEACEWSSSWSPTVRAWGGTEWVSTTSAVPLDLLGRVVTDPWEDPSAPSSMLCPP